MIDKKINVTAKFHYDFPAEMVFDAWLDPHNARNWLFATPDGVMKQVEIDAVVGGGFIIVENRPAGDAAHFGKFLRIVRPVLLEFTFSVDQTNSDPDLVLVEFVSMENSCDVTLSHQMDARWADYIERTKAGWSLILAGLNNTLLQHKLI
jgi:uncharacterized protein YndB with AHSA1/START domain